MIRSPISCCLARPNRIAAAALAIAALAIGLAAPASAVTAPEAAVSERAEVRLHADHNVAAPGATVTLALEQKLGEGWHTYWANPGDSGAPTMIAWTAPAGVQIGAIEWPSPERALFFDLINYGFTGEAILLSRLQVPETWPMGRPIEIAATVDWLVCAEICVPERQAFSMMIPVGPGAIADPEAARIVARGESAQPVALNGPARVGVTDSVARIALDRPEPSVGPVTDAYFFAYEANIGVPAAPQRFETNGETLLVEFDRGGAAIDGALRGVLEVTETPSDGGAPLTRLLEINAAPGAVSPLTSAAAAAPAVGAPGDGGSASRDLGLGLGASTAAAALLAFLGGVILNVMPCVFPVLALKAVALAHGAQATARARLVDGLAYAAGVLVCFLAFAAALVSLQSAGALVGWGFQLQEPGVVAALAAILFVIGLNLSGLFELRLAVSGGPFSRLSGQDGATGSFFTGALAAIVASPCTAPFMGAALGYALTQSAVTAFVVFAALGIGFAAPIVLLAASPALGRLLPKPGPWLIRFRQFLAFPMYLAAAWLLWVLGGQAGVDAVFAALIGFVLLAMAAWIGGVGWPSGLWPRRAAMAGALAAVLGAVASLGSAAAPPPPPSAREEPFSLARLEALRDDGRTVFVNMTADWCVSCKVNERLVLAGEGFQDALSRAEAVYLRGDWTSPNDEIAAYLQRYGVSGIPLYVVYISGADGVVLPQVLTEGLVAEALGG